MDETVKESERARNEFYVWITELAAKEFPFDWHGGIDENSKYRVGFELGAMAAYQELQIRFEKLVAAFEYCVKCYSEYEDTSDFKKAIAEYKSTNKSNQEIHD